jgi:diguanylate cyclase (GGDEF)-like protein
MNDTHSDASRRTATQLEALFRRTRLSSLLALLPIVLLAGLHVGHVATGTILAWAATMLAIYAIRIAIAHGFLTRPSGGEASPLWLDVETMATAAAGAAWGSMLFLLDSGRLDMLFTVKLAFLAAACAFTMNSMAVVRFVYFTFLMPIFVAVCAYALMEAPFLDTASRYGLIASATLFFTLLLAMSTSVSRLINESLMQRLAYADLAAQLDTTLAAERALREQLEQQTRQLEATHLRQHVFATHDPLTRVFNRHRICEALVRELHLQRRFRIPVSALIVEIDAYAEFCAAHGQARADELLVAFATFLAADLREIDYVGRWGGEKFCCALPRTDGREALECAERLRRRIAGRAFLEAQPELQVTASFGVSVAVDGDDPERLLARADAALYAARRDGRNSCRNLDEGQPA